VNIRDANERDWDEIFPFFAAIVDQGATYAYPDALTKDEARALWMQASPNHCVVAVEDDRVIATATMGPNRPGRGSHVATASFMVDPQSRGRGAGWALGKYVIEWARAGGFRAIQFNAVVETNESAVRLWKKLGFEVLATVPEAFDHRDIGLVGLHVMYLPL
jgi:L-amino acid N-acyltransferase YncA